MAKIEVVIDGDQVPVVGDLFIEAGGAGYTGVSGVSGFGHHGHHRPAPVQRSCQPVHAHHRRAPRQRSRRWSRASGACSRAGTGLLRHPDPREPPPLLALSDLPARVDLQRGQVPGPATVPSGTTARSARWWHAGQLSNSARTCSTAEAAHPPPGTELAQGGRQAVEVVPARSGDAVGVIDDPAGAVGTGGDTPDEEVLDAGVPPRAVRRGPGECAAND